MSNNSILGHTLFASISILIGYPYGGIVFRSIMILYIGYMIFRQESGFIPALLLHCSSETMVMPITYIFICLLCITKYHEIKQYKANIPFIIILSLSPIIIYLIINRFISTRDFNYAIISTVHYWSFYAFFYGILIYRNFNKTILNYTLIAISFCIITYLLNIYTARILMVAIAIVLNFIIYISLKRRWTIIDITIILLSILLLVKMYITFTILATFLLSFLIIRFYNKKKLKLLKSITGISAFITIFALLYIGISIYDKISFGYMTDRIETLSFSERLKFKFFSDRAPYWNVTLQTIIKDVGFFPSIETIPVVMNSKSGHDLDIDFGGHNSYLELIRLYGWLIGCVLISIFIWMILNVRNVFDSKIPILFNIFFSSILAYNLVMSFTGTAIMGSSSILSFSILGLMYTTSIQYKQNEISWKQTL